MKTTKQLQAAINAIAKTSSTLQDRIQAVFIEVAEHALMNGEASLVGQLANALGQGMKREKFLHYAQAVLPVVINNDKETRQDRPFKWSSKKAKSEAFSDTLEVLAQIKDGNAWYDYVMPVPEQQVKVEYDAAKGLMALLKNIEKAKAENLAIKGLSPEQIEQLGKLVAQINSKAEAAPV